MPTYKTKTITVTREHFERGREATARSADRTRGCAMVQALFDAFPGEEISSGNRYVCVGRKYWKLDDTGYEITMAFDKHKGVVPDDLILPARVKLTESMP